MIEEFERHLRGTNLSENTISSYLLQPFDQREQFLNPLDDAVLLGERR